MVLVGKRRVILDTGPLVAFLAHNESRHRWAVEQFQSLPAPFFTCEAVLTEAFYLLSRGHDGPSRLFELLSCGALAVDFSASAEFKPLQKHLDKYKDLPMSFADACLVRMFEVSTTAVVLTFDHHFKIYRVNGRQMIDIIMPQK